MGLRAHSRGHRDVPEALPFECVIVCRPASTGRNPSDTRLKGQERYSIPERILPPWPETTSGRRATRTGSGRGRGPRCVRRGRPAAPLDGTTSSCSRSRRSCSRGTRSTSRPGAGAQSAPRAGETARAVRCAFWIGLNLLTRGAVGPARGWFARGERLLADESDCVERGYLVLPELQHVIEGDPAAAHDTAAEVAATGRASATATSSRSSPRAGARADPPGPGRGRPAAPRRVHGLGHRRRALPDRDGHRLLQHDRVLPGASSRCGGRATGRST